MTEYTDAELADMCEQAADLLKDNAYPDTCESIQIAAARLRARSEDTERLIAVMDRFEIAALSLACGSSVRDLDEICSDARNAVYSARKREE